LKVFLVDINDWRENDDRHSFIPFVFGLSVYHCFTQACLYVTVTQSSPIL